MIVAWFKKWKADRTFVQVAEAKVRCHWRLAATNERWQTVETVKFFETPKGKRKVEVSAWQVRGVPGVFLWLRGNDAEPDLCRSYEIVKAR